MKDKSITITRAEENALMGALSRAIDEWEAELDDLSCYGHESLDGAHMGETVTCDGSCNPGHKKRTKDLKLVRKVLHKLLVVEPQ